jgi:hypothetical protein
MVVSLVSIIISVSGGVTFVWQNHIFLHAAEFGDRDVDIAVEPNGIDPDATDGAAEAPAGGDDVVDEIGFHLVAGLEADVMGFFEFFEFQFRFVREYESGGGADVTIGTHRVFLARLPRFLSFGQGFVPPAGSNSVS